MAIVIGMAVATLSLPALARPGRSTPPSTPGNFHVTVTTSGSVSFAWNASTPGSGGSLIYEIYNDTTGLVLNVGNVTSYTWTVGIQVGGTYSFHIIAVSGNQASASSPKVTVTIPGAPPIPPAVRPDPPVITQTSVTSNTITVSWTEGTPADEIGSYEVLVNGIEDGGGSANSTTSIATGLTPGYTYTITVVAYSLNATTGALSTKS
jgi:chitinase